MAIFAVIVFVINESVQNSEHDLVKLTSAQCRVLLLLGKQLIFEVSKSNLQVLFTDAPHARQRRVNVPSSLQASYLCLHDIILMLDFFLDGHDNQE